MTPRAVVVAAVGFITLAVVARGQTPNTIVDVQLVGVGSTTVEAILTADSVLLLPAADVHQLLGLPMATVPWLTVAQLQQQFPPIDVRWIPRALLVVIRDELLALPASRATRDALVRRATGASPFAQIASGPFAAITADALGRTLLDGGYNWRGRVSVTAQRSSTRGTAWSVNLAPVSALNLGFSQQGATSAASGRLAVGPAWLQASWLRGQALMVDGLLKLGVVSVFGSPQRDAYAITIRGPVTVQWGRTGSTSAARVSVGPIPPSPFVVPAVP